MTQTCQVHLTIENPWGPVRFTMPSIVLPGRGAVFIIRQKTFREKRGIDDMAKLKASVMKAHGCEDGPEMEIYSWCCGRAQRWRCAEGGDGCHGVRAGRRRGR